MKLERDSLEAQIADLRLQADELKANLEKMKEGRILVLAGELLMQMPIDPTNIDEKEIENAIEKLISNAKLALSIRTGLQPEDIDIHVREEELKKAVKETVESKRRKVVRLIVATNAAVGERIDCLISVKDSVLVYKAGEILASEVFTERLSEAEAELALYNLLRQVNVRAQEDGILPDPITGAAGNLEATEFFDAVENLSNANPPFKVNVIAVSDIYTEGPVRVKIELD